MNLNNFFNSQTKTVTFAAILLAISAVISAILGLIRDRLLAGQFGAGEALDIYFAAFRIPDFVYGILIMGGISAVFLPVFAEYFKKGEKVWEFTNNVLNCFLFLLILICGLLFIFTPLIIKFITPGFSLENQKITIALTRIMFISPIFFGLSSIFSGILQYFQRFLAFSLAPILYNLGIIFGILYFVPIFGIYGLSYGVILGAAFHFLIQLPAVKISGFKYQPLFNFKYPGLIRVFKLMIPRTIGTTAFQLNLIVITAIASTITAGSIAIFNFANNLQGLPVGLIGASFALAAFPVLSRAWAGNQREEFLENFSSTFRQILFLIIPISLAMFLLRAQIVRLILGTGQFGWLETRLTAASLGIFCFGIFAFSLIPFLARVYYSFQDTKTPLLISLISLAFNISLCFLLVWLLSFPNVFQNLAINFLKLSGIKNIALLGLPLALVLSGILQFSLLLIFLQKKIGDIRIREIWNSFQKIILASSFMVFSTYLTLQIAARFVDMATFLGVLTQTILAALLAILTYLAMTFLLKSPELKTIKSSIIEQRKTRETIDNS